MNRAASSVSAYSDKTERDKHKLQLQTGRMAAAASQATEKKPCYTDLDKARVTDPDGRAASPSIKRKPQFSSQAHGAAVLVNKPGAEPCRAPGPGQPPGPHPRSPPGRGSAARPGPAPSPPGRGAAPPRPPAQPATTKAERCRRSRPFPARPRRPLTVLREDVEAALGRAPRRLPAAPRRPARAAPSRSPRLLLLLGWRLLLEPGARLPDAAHLLPHRRAAGRGPPLTCRRSPARRAASRSSPACAPRRLPPAPAGPAALRPGAHGLSPSAPAAILNHRAPGEGTERLPRSSRGGRPLPGWRAVPPAGGGSRPRRAGSRPPEVAEASAVPALRRPVPAWGRELRVVTQGWLGSGVRD